VQVDFYRIAHGPVAPVLAAIAARVLKGGDRLLVVADDARAAALDEALWTIAPDSFLPHGRAGDDDPGTDQPVLIAADCATSANGARLVALADGVWRDEALAFDRAFHLFEEDAIDAARAAWRGLAKAEGVTRNFWARDADGRWSKAG
jgi:DNA polymerase-3 subunit chi